MPLLWRFLLGIYCRIFLLTTFSFILILFVSRLKEIAFLATLKGGSRSLLLFIGYLVPTILPIALPIAALLGALLLFQKLSDSHELTALRSAGLSLFTITTPLLGLGLILSILNFFIVSEVTTHSHYSSKQLANHLRSINPLILLENKHLLNFRDIFIQMETVEKGKEAKNLIIVSPNERDDQFNLLMADKLELENKSLKASGVVIVAKGDTLPSEPDHLIIENQKEMRALNDDLSGLLKRGDWQVKNDYFRLPYLLVRKDKIASDLALAQDPGQKKNIKNTLHSIQLEIARRFSLGLAPFTFTLMGMSFGMSISRHRSKKGSLLALGLSMSYLLSYFVGRELSARFWLGIFLFFIPHFLILFFSIYTLRRISRGLE